MCSVLLPQGDNPTADNKYINVNISCHHFSYKNVNNLRDNENIRLRSWLKHCATSRKVVGSIPDVVTGIFR